MVRVGALITLGSCVQTPLMLVNGVHIWMDLPPFPVSPDANVEHYSHGYSINLVTKFVNSSIVLAAAFLQISLSTELAQSVILKACPWVAAHFSGLDITLT